MVAVPGTAATPSTTARGDAAREAILDAALDRFGRYGLRRTSMEDIARQAGVSRTSIYFHFGSKDQVFRALSEHLHEESLAAMEHALNADGGVEERLRTALEARLGRFVELTATSPHGAELLDEHSRVCGDVAGAARARSLRLLQRAIRDAAAAGELDPGRVGLTAGSAAELILDCAGAVKEAGETVSARVYRRRLGQLVRVLVAGMGGR
jgi:AcrR family transcriptional regulator